LAEVPLQRATAGKDVVFEWMPFELRPSPTPTLRPKDAYLQSAWRSSVYPLAERLGLEMHLPSVSPQPYTRLAHEGTEYVKAHGKADVYTHAVFTAFFQRSEDIGSADVLSRIAGVAGLDVADFRRALDEGRFRARTDELLRQARLQMVNAVPTFIIGRRRLSGLYPAEALAEIVDAELAKPE
jgi:predicted DsbA family dithiol-disulfide isomerase